MYAQRLRYDLTNGLSGIQAGIRILKYDLHFLSQTLHLPVIIGKYILSLINDLTICMGNQAQDHPSYR